MRKIIHTAVMFAVAGIIALLFSCETFSSDQEETSDSTTQSIDSSQTGADTVIVEPGPEVNRSGAYHIVASTFSPHGDTLYIAAHNKTTTTNYLVVIDLATVSVTRRIEAHSELIFSVRVHPSGYFLATGSKDTTVKLWDTETWKNYRTIDTDYAINSVAFDARGWELYFAGNNAQLKKINAFFTGIPVTLVDAKGHEHSDDILVITTDHHGRLLASGCKDDSIKLWRTSGSNDQKGWQKTMTGHEDMVLCLAFDPNGQYLYSGSMDHSVRVWDLDTGREVKTLTGHNEQVFWLATDRYGYRLFTTDASGITKVWDTKTWECMATFKDHEGSIQTVTTDPRNRFFVTGGYDKKLVLRDVKTLDKVAEISIYDDALVITLPSYEFGGQGNYASYITEADATENQQAVKALFQ